MIAGSQQTTPSSPSTIITSTTTKLRNNESLFGLPAIQSQPANPDWRRRKRRKPLSNLAKQKFEKRIRQQHCQTILQRRWKNGRIQKHIRKNPKDFDFYANMDMTIACAYAVLPESMMMPMTTLTTTKPPRPFRIGMLVKQDSIRKLAELAHDHARNTRRHGMIANDDETVGHRTQAERIRRSIIDTPLFLIVFYYIPTRQERQNEYDFDQVDWNDRNGILLDIPGVDDYLRTDGRDEKPFVSDDFGAFLRKCQMVDNSSLDKINTSSIPVDEMINLNWALAGCQNIKLFWRSRGYVCLIQQPEYIFSSAFRQLVHAKDTERVAAILKLGAYDPNDRASKPPFGYIPKKDQKFTDTLDLQ